MANDSKKNWRLVDKADQSQASKYRQPDATSDDDSAPQEASDPKRASE